VQWRREANMKKVTKMLSALLLTALMLSAIVVPASAAGYSNSASETSSSSFTSEWEKTRTYKVGSTVVAYMIFGYDKDWIFEDYVWTKATQCYSTAMVYRNGYDTGWNYCTGSEAGKNSYSTIEVTHQTYLVYYKMQLSASYSNVTYTTAASSVK